MRPMASRTPTARLRRALIPVFAGVSLAAPAQASAAATVNVTTSADPVEDVAFQVTVAGRSDDLRNLYATRKPAGGQPCGVTYAADEGGQTFISGVDVNGDYAEVRNVTLAESGDYVFCAWVQTTSGSTAADAATSKPVTIRVPRATGAVRAPGVVDAGSNFQIAIDTQAEVERNLYVDVNAPAVPCGANYEANRAVNGIVAGLDILGGPATHTVNFTAPDQGGTYTVCAWVQETSGDTVAEATFGGQFAVNGVDCLRARASVPRYRRAAARHSRNAKKYKKLARRTRGSARRRHLKRARRASRSATRSRAAMRRAQAQAAQRCQ